MIRTDASAGRWRFPCVQSNRSPDDFPRWKIHAVDLMTGKAVGNGLGFAREGSHQKDFPQSGNTAIRIIDKNFLMTACTHPGNIKDRCRHQLAGAVDVRENQSVSLS